MAYWDKAALIRRLGFEAAREMLDRNNDGQPDDDMIADYQTRSQAYVDGACYDVFALPFDANGATVPPEITRLTLDVARAFLAIDFPEYYRIDSMALLTAVDKQLDKLRTAKRGTAQTPPDPAANQGGKLVPPLDPAKHPAFGTGKWGIF